MKEHQIISSLEVSKIILLCNDDLKACSIILLNELLYNYKSLISITDWLCHVVMRKLENGVFFPFFSLSIISNKLSSFPVLNNSLIAKMYPFLQEFNFDQSMMDLAR